MSTRHIAVLMPIRNDAGFLGPALKSVAEQTVASCAVILIDDGSTDSTPMVLDAFEREHGSRFKVQRLRTDGVGIARALNRGLEAADAEWIARMDADDVCDPKRLELQLRETEQNPAARLVSCGVKVQATGENEGMLAFAEWCNAVRAHAEIERALWIDSPLPHPTWLVHREAWRLVGLYEETPDVPEDYDWLQRFFLVANERGWQASKTAETLLFWRDHPARLTRVHEAYRHEAFLKVKAKFLKRLLTGKRVWLLGLGPGGKRAFQMLLEAGIRPCGVVDVHPGRIGNRYLDAAIIGIEAWRRSWAAGSDFALIALGTRRSRERCERFCEGAGLRFGADFIAL